MTGSNDDDVLTDGETLPLAESDEELDAMCEAWVTWCRERHLQLPVPVQSAGIAQRGGSTRPLRRTGDFAIPRTSLAAIHIAYACQPSSLDKQVFDLYYVARVRPIKTAAAALGIGRRHFYRVLGDFRERLCIAAKSFAEGGPQVEKIISVNDKSET